MSQSVITEDEEVADYSVLFPQWDGNGIEYAVGFKCRYNGILYKVFQAHASQETWNPVDAPSLFAKVLIPDPSIIPEWEQPESTNPYIKGIRLSTMARLGNLSLIITYGNPV